MSERRRTGSRNEYVTVLSRFFDDNVRLVAGVCSECYREEEEVKIVAVNRRFLRQTEARKEARCSAEFLHDVGRLPYTDEASPRHCQGVRLKLSSTSAHNIDAPISTTDDDASRGRRLKPQLRLDCRNYRRREEGTTNGCAATENLPDRPECDADRPASVLRFSGAADDDVKTEKVEKSDFDIGDLSEGDRSKYENVGVKVEDPKFCGVNLSKLKTWKLQRTRDPTTAYETSTTAIKAERLINEVPPVRSVNLKKLRRRIPLWNPPRSPHNLIEESLFRNPWSLLVATIFLNRTSCMCARPRVEEFLRDFSGPWEVLEKRPPELERYFLDLGLHKRRAEQVWRMSHDYVHKNWRNAKELYGIGKYGEDAYRMFVLGDLDVEPTDRFLRIYRDWAKMKEREEKMKTMEDD